jgi:hypothetical protein
MQYTAENSDNTQEPTHSDKIFDKLVDKGREAIGIDFNPRTALDEIRNNGNLLNVVSAYLSTKVSATVRDAATKYLSELASDVVVASETATAWASKRAVDISANYLIRGVGATAGGLAGVTLWEFLHTPPLNPDEVGMTPEAAGRAFLQSSYGKAAALEWPAAASPEHRRINCPGTPP